PTNQTSVELEPHTALMSVIGAPAAVTSDQAVPSKCRSVCDGDVPAGGASPPAQTSEALAAHTASRFRFVPLDCAVHALLSRCKIVPPSPTANTLSAAMANTPCKISDEGTGAVSVHHWPGLVGHGGAIVTALSSTASSTGSGDVVQPATRRNKMILCVFTGSRRW